MANQVKLLVGTRKGAWVYTSDERRESWDLSEPMMPGWSVYHMAGDVRGGEPRMYAAANHWAWGRSVSKSTDLGKEWNWTSQDLGFPQDMGVTIKNVWNVRPGPENEPGVVYAGVEPAGLFRSEDWGHSWRPVDELNRHEDRRYWGESGGGDSCVHSIEIDPRDANRMYIAISSGGSYLSNDGGRTWDIFSHVAIPETMKAREFMEQILRDSPDQEVRPGIDPMAVNEMHKMRLDPKDPDRIWTQTHIGVFRSEDMGRSFQDVTPGLPSFHGFPIAVTRSGPDAAFVVPLEFEANNFRVCPGQFAVYRTRDGGNNWERMTNGLPGPHDYQSVYREGMDTDALTPGGVYVGTTNGEVYASTDLGESWRRLPGTLPPILSVAAFVI